MLSPLQASDAAYVRVAALQEAGIADSPGLHVRILKRSIDGRARSPRIRLRVHVSTHPPEDPKPLTTLRHANSNKRVIIVGAGPAGYFAALELLRQGIMPIVLDRGKDVRSRRRDLRLLQQEGIVNPNSNYCFGEGGAGTYSDGKLYTRAQKRGNVRDVLELLVAHGASADILVDAHPHVGSNKLWLVVQRIRESILEYGGSVHFDANVNAFLVSQQRGQPTIKGVGLLDGREFLGDAVILATGHSARDIFTLCADSGVSIEEKSFALGVRVEHPQALIDEIQYHQSPRDLHLPAASYGLTCQSNGRGVFSFCMCPGGIIVPAATAPGEIVVNGMSMSRRDSLYANSGVVVEVTGGVALQRSVEQRAFASVDGHTQRAPAQRLVDFVNQKQSINLPSTSYIPGVASVEMDAVLPFDVASRLRDAFRQFDKKMRGYLTNEAIVVATESRTSSPIRIPRDSQTLQSTSMVGLYPCGEGAGYAGGIMSAALDGQRVARAIGEQW